ncbi:hypothetical protein OTSUT76_2773 [Orientia tsutsugamushi str. UT76]|uniref:DUF8042 domain-containing protein n=1 Tax=Orientia tsutsugamushi TaxID=784 RepID=A0A2U3RGE2_ORITS|nr:hypothetical protein [Orientia tsutsugamushi]KJV74977.1 hypothetical protein OTSUT76_2773 [Orientia tsutsugamushi str. UT76]SPR12230.1 Uncharacterised protein [Orientia tsutsugamushi]
MPHTVSDSSEDKEELLVTKIAELEQSLKGLEQPLDKYIKKHGLTEQSKNLLDGLTKAQEELEKLKSNQDPTNTDSIWKSFIKALTKFISTIKELVTGEPDQSISNSIDKISSFIEEAEKTVQEDTSILQSVCNKLKKLYNSSTISSDTPEKGIGGTTTPSPEEPAHASFKGGAAGFAALAEQLAEKYGHSSTREEEDSSKSKHNKKSLLGSSEALASSSASFLETAKQLSSNLNPSATPKTTPTAKGKKGGYSK